jgi:Ni/Fe-hydrogenase subunit HybB-like protein
LIPILFFVSSIFAGLSLVIFEGSISHRVFQDRLSPEVRQSHNEIVFGLGRIAGAVMFVYLFLEALKFLHGQLWRSFGGVWGAWYLLEIAGLTAVPMVLLLVGSAKRKLGVVRAATLMAVLGVVLNRLNISVIAFKWYEPVHYVPTWMEVVVTAGVLCAEIWVFRWVVLRMPVLSQSPEWARRSRHASGKAQQAKYLAA